MLHRANSLYYKLTNVEHSSHVHCVLGYRCQVLEARCDQCSKFDASIGPVKNRLSTLVKYFVPFPFYKCKMSVILTVLILNWVNFRQIFKISFYCSGYGIFQLESIWCSLVYCMLKFVYGEDNLGPDAISDHTSVLLDVDRHILKLGKKCWQCYRQWLTTFIKMHLTSACSQIRESKMLVEQAVFKLPSSDKIMQLIKRMLAFC